jgi:hypothetical protein
MNKTAVVTSFTFLFLAFGAGSYAQEEIYQEEIEEVYKEDEEKDRPVFLFSEGAAASWLTRIIYQTDRSNFVFKDFLPGLYFRTDVTNLKFKNLTPMARIAAYYPLVSTFNGVPQLSKTPLHIGADFSLGLNFDIFDFKYFSINAGPTIHLFFLTADRWNYFDLGVAAFLGIDVPLFKNWTILVNGYASLDNGNLGHNRLMEPFNIVYQYQIDVGVRYSKKIENKTYLFPFQNESDTSLFQR